MEQRRDRRQFGKDVAGVAAGAMVAGAAPASAGQPDQGRADPRTATLQALMEIVQARYGEHLGDKQLQQVRQKIANGLAMAEALKKTPLANGDEPDFVFQA